VTTPYDMMINQIVERERGGDRHGSCGVGFGETSNAT
jgi:adenylosuccinate synthase